MKEKDQTIERKENIVKKTGKVVTAGMDKSASVLVASSKVHPLYGKRYAVSRKFIVHDEKNEAQVGDLVEIQPTRKISKCKSWKISKIISRGQE